MEKQKTGFLSGQENYILKEIKSKKLGFVPNSS